MKLWKLHRKYLFTKTNLILLVCFVIGMILFFLISSGFYHSKANQILFSSDYQNHYLYNTQMIMKMILPFISSYLFSYSFIKNNGYAVLVKRSKRIFFTTKIISIIFIILLIWFSLFCMYCFIGLVLTKWFKITLFSIDVFVIIFEVSIVYGLISFIISYCLNNPFGQCISYLLFISGEILKESNIYVFELFFPLINNDSEILYELQLTNHLHNFILIIIYFLLSLFIYELIDLRN